MTDQERQELNDLLIWKHQMEASHSIPLNVDQAIRGRFVDAVTMKPTTKTATSENVSINEGGAAVKTVLGPPDAFKKIVVDGVLYYCPLYL
jgi:hypothetical protein